MILIALISVSITALVLENSDQLDLASLPSLNLPLTELSPPAQTASDNTPDPDGLPLLDPGLPGVSLLNPTSPDKEPSSFNANLDIPESFAFSPISAEDTTVNGAAESSITNPPTMHIEAQSPGDDFNEVCHDHTRAHRKRQNQELSCKIPELFVHGTRPLNTNQLGRTEEQQKNDELSYHDQKYISKVGAMSKKDRDRILDTIEDGEFECLKQGWAGIAGEYPWALCCLGPDEFFMVPSWRQRLVRRDVRIRNIFNCQFLIVGRPFCARLVQRFCCRSVDTGTIAEWGFKGLDCTQMETNIDDRRPSKRSENQ